MQRQCSDRERNALLSERLMKCLKHHRHVAAIVLDYQAGFRSLGSGCVYRLQGSGWWQHFDARCRHRKNKVYECGNGDVVVFEEDDKKEQPQQRFVLLQKSGTLRLVPCVLQQVIARDQYQALPYALLQQLLNAGMPISYARGLSNVGFAIEDASAPAVFKALRRLQILYVNPKDLIILRPWIARCRLYDDDLNKGGTDYRGRMSRRDFTTMSASREMLESDVTTQMCCHCLWLQWRHDERIVNHNINSLYGNLTHDLMRRQPHCVTLPLHRLRDMNSLHFRVLSHLFPAFRALLMERAVEAQIVARELVVISERNRKQGVLLLSYAYKDRVSGRVVQPFWAHDDCMYSRDLAMDMEKRDEDPAGQEQE